MDARYGERLELMLVEAHVDEEVLQVVPERLGKFVEPFNRALAHSSMKDDQKSDH